MLKQLLNVVVMLPDDISEGLSNNDCVTASFTKSIGTEGTRDMTSNNAIHSSGIMVIPWIQVMNVFAPISVTVGSGGSVTWTN